MLEDCVCPRKVSHRFATRISFALKRVTSDIKIFDIRITSKFNGKRSRIAPYIYCLLWKPCIDLITGLSLAVRVPTVLLFVSPINRTIIKQ